MIEDARATFVASSRVGSVEASPIHVEQPGLNNARDAAIATWSNANLFHTSRWLEVLRVTLGFEAFVLTDRTEDGELLGLLPIMLVNSPLTGRRLVSLRPLP